MTGLRRWSRRDVLKALGTSGAVVTASALTTRPVAGFASNRRTTKHDTPVSALDPMIIIDGTDVRALAMRALDAAKAAGATYADVRLTRTLTQVYRNNDFAGEGEIVAIGVRAFIGGASGFASSPYWNLDAAARLAQDAVRQARTNAQEYAGVLDWTPIPVVSGHWAIPVQYDPFVIPIEEKLDLFKGWRILARQYKWDRESANAWFRREERAVATSEGAYFTQTLYSSGGNCSLENTWLGIGARATGLTTVAAGWEVFLEADIPAQMPRLYEDMLKELKQQPSIKSGDVGRYSVVFDAVSMAGLLESTIGVAAQVDRALGYEANAGGTSYLGPDPLALLGSYQAASPMVSVTGNRSMPRGLATVKWDDEGVAPDDFTLVKNGILVDYQTTREQAQWLAPWYQKQGKPIRSHGCAGAQSALYLPMQFQPNLVLEAGTHDIGFEDLVADVKQGLAVLRAGIGTDFQNRTGESRNAKIREIVNGRLGAIITGLEFSFDATQIWKNVTALGGVKSVHGVVGRSVKGEPAQDISYTVQAVPARISNVAFIDPKRKA